MLSVQLALLKAIASSALSLQLVQPIIPAESIRNPSFATPKELQAAANASLRSALPSTIPPEWDGTIALPLNVLNISLHSPPSNDPSPLWNDTYISTLNISAGPRPAPSLPPLPHGWALRCSARMGSNINPSSCLEAWALIPPIERTLSFGPRDGTNTYDVMLPKRYQSCTLRHSPMPLVPC